MFLCSTGMVEPVGSCDCMIGSFVLNSFWDSVCLVAAASILLEQCFVH